MNSPSEISEHGTNRPSEIEGPGYFTVTQKLFQRRRNLQCPHPVSKETRLPLFGQAVNFAERRSANLLDPWDSKTYSSSVGNVMDPQILRVG
ncbi:hypothetical protein A6X21_21050 [Planctopirus hydrillae]|uniref:Uncharacterized protein n=1 Tax=Planctopirus hydrillae TaxID=1841610 RepID=A0A1C3EHU9_9PLAN|nr:hypothetical protein A6X21_21050 [Planctopirus hydrillae]